MSNTFKDYKMPDHLIEQKISQYNDLIISHQMKIRDLKRIQSERAAVRKHRAKMNNIADYYLSSYNEREKSTDFINKIMIELRCERSYAESIAAIVRRTVAKKDQAKRNAQIILLSERLKVVELASMYNLSRQQVHNILKDKPSYF